MSAKPQRLFARDTEWGALSEFTGSAQPGATLGLVYGRRRQGKTLMLELLARETGGFLFAATQQSEAQNLADLGRAYAEYRGIRRPVLFADWREALDEILRIGEESELPVVIDEFPYLVAATPALPSYLQQALSPLSHAKEHTRTRLILCGSALTTMAQLLSGGAPLRGRASLELVVRPFRYREAAAFWGVATEPELAFRLNALVGGTPAYKEMCGGAGPVSVDDFDGWVQRRLLNPASAMFREGSLLLREEPSIADPTSYASVLTAVSSGQHRRSEIAATLGRPSSALAHLLAGLQDIGLLEQTDDALRERRSVFRVAEPVVRLHQLLIQRHEPELVIGRADQVWADNADTIAARIYGPHFEDLARQWCAEHAAEATLGGKATVVRPTEMPCREHKRGHEIDVVVTESLPFNADRVTAIGEAKGTATPMDLPHLQRLEHLRGLLPSTKVGTLPKLLLFARSGFSDALRQTADDRSDVELVDLNRLYAGD
ncbi:ATP-binding protein [Streptomyces sp. A3M-1-3]|uniref:AAA family ATPase n=1 Tax=Streptomyces sp. A3M-1-3 TaxID=2962044 RepID=UPI0020B7121D|nr:ATP-binding protein [Streptomyces sp. A3M-1-3]MCP3819476.1 ATP-binding protein [Streptomyces sp. A3M-1-3]